MSQNTVATGFEFKYAVVDLADDDTEVTAKRAMIRGVYINVALSAHSVPVQDGTSTVFSIPASSSAGQFIPFGDVVFDGGITIDPNDSATGSITIVYKTVV